MEGRSNFADILLEVLKENQKTLNHVIRLSGDSQQVLELSTQQKQIQSQVAPVSNGHSSVSIDEVLEKMSELIELNKVTLQTIDLLDKRIKRLHSVIDEKFSVQSQPSVKEDLIEEQQYA